MINISHTNYPGFSPQAPSASKILMLIICIALFLFNSAYSQDLDDDNDGIPNSYEKGMGDSSLDNIFNIGTANNSAIEISDNEIQLTQDIQSLRGSAMSIGKIDFNFDFTFAIQAYFGVNNGLDGISASGADGIAMVFHNDPDGSDAIGDDGEGIGAQGIENGIVLEIDTYGNGNTGANDPLRGTEDDHTDIWDSDDDTRTSLIGGYILYDNGGDRDVEDGQYHEVIFNWISNTGTLSFTIDGISAGSITTGSAANFISTYFNGSNTVHFGFTASTGGSRNEHRIRIDDIDNLPLVLDSDNDGIYDHLDLDSDNDGIYDAEEAGHGAPHTNGVVDGGDIGGDGIPDEVQTGAGSGEIDYVIADTDGDGSYNNQETDADDDGCYDIIEVGFTDSDNNGLLGTGVPTVDANGVVQGATDGYTIPTSSDYTNVNASICTPSTDLGDDGDGDDALVTFIEDSPAIDLMDNPIIADIDDFSYESIQITVSGVIDGNEEILTIGGVQFALATQVTNPVTVNLNGETVQITYIGNVFTFTEVGADGAISDPTAESLLNGMTYIHTDQEIPTDGNRVLSIVVSDGTTTGPPNTVTINVDPVNDAPLADDDNLTLDEGDLATVNLALNDFDIDGTLDLASIIITSYPENGTVVINDDGTVTYIHDGSDTTTDSFSYTITDDEGTVSNIADVNVNVNPVNDTGDNESPIASNDNFTVSEGNSTIVNLALNDVDPDGELDLGSIEILLAPDHGTIVINDDGTITYTHDGSATLSDDFAYIIRDDEGTISNIATVSVTVNPAENDDNDTPVAADDNATVNEGDSLVVGSKDGVLANDFDADGDSLMIVSFTVEDVNYPAGTTVTLTEGTITLNPDGSYTFVPADGYTDTIPEITYIVSDGEATDAGTLTIVIEKEADPTPEIPIETSSLITNNGDDRNSRFVIRNIDLFPNNQVCIFNRWGNLVWKIAGYDNEDLNKSFMGYPNQMGAGSSNGLPDGTYYYVINKGDGSSPVKGFLILENN